jgi:polar amino acid transport system substrate-binding protein
MMKQYSNMALTARTLLTCALLIVGSSALSARPLDDVVESKVLKVVTYADYAPFSWEVDGVATGIEVDLGRAIAKELGVEAEIIQRIAGEKVDDDLRGGVWKGPLTGGGVGDVMLHVPTDRELAMRNKEAVIGNPYFQETIALAIDPKKVAKDSTFDVFKTQKIGVKMATVSDYFLMTFEDGALIENISHHIKSPVGAKEFMAGETAALLGVRSETEGVLHNLGGKAVYITPNMDGIVRTQWVVGTAVNEQSRDLSYAIGTAIGKLKESGELQKIFAKYGVTYLPPPGS